MNKPADIHNAETVALWINGRTQAATSKRLGEVTNPTDPLVGVADYGEDDVRLMLAAKAELDAAFTAYMVEVTEPKLYTIL